MPAPNIFYDPSGGAQAQSLKCDSFSGFDAGIITGNCSAIFGGIPAGVPTNCNESDLSAIIMGDTNCIINASSDCYNLIGNGCSNSVSGCFASIFNGMSNTVNGIGSTIAAGDGNSINASNSFVGGGKGNSIINTIDSFIGSGCGNIIRATRANAYIGGGCGNSIVCGTASYIGGGDTNSIVENSNCSVVSGGNLNSIGTAGMPLATGSMFSVISGGMGNCIDTSTGIGSCFAAIGGGCGHVICDGTNNSSIFGGDTNIVAGNWSAVLGGSDHCVFSNNSFIGSGDTNTVFAGSDCSGISAGNLNSIGTSGGAGSIFGYIGGGQQNWIEGSGGACYGVVSGGFNNCIDTTCGLGSGYAVIGGGAINFICDGTQNASIFSGTCGMLSGNYSAILGGTLNCDNALDHVGIFGCNVTGAVACAFHANTFVAQNMIDASISGVPSGSGVLYYCSCFGRALYITV